ncbi:hypothetical protein KKF23_01775 [Patescibacteria group bacterium]|nr:hypothetical protein [Patescibacteria group bacterium]
MKKTKRFFNLFINLFLTAILVINQAVFLLAPMNFARAQDATATDTSTIIFPDATIDTTDTSINYILFLNFQSPPAKVSGSAVFYVETSEEADVVFYVLKDGAILNKFPAVYQGNKVYYFKWDAASLNNGQYAVRANAYKSGYIDISKQINVIVENITTTNSQTNTTASTNIEPKIDYSIQPIENKLSPDIYNNTTAPTTPTIANTVIVNTVLDVQPKPIEQPILRENIYLVQIFPECREKGINTEEECKKFMSIPPECRYKGILTLDECGKYMSIPPECRDRGLTKEECDKFMSVSPECRKQGIMDQEACKKYMYKYAMPYECQKAGAATQEGCSKIIFNNSLPQECREAGAKTQEECEKIMRSRVNLTSSLPADCLNAGIATQESCKKFIFEKYGGQENIPADKLPVECQKAGVKTPEECEKVMRKMYMPQECQSQGITDEDSCQKYLELKNMPQECRSAGAKTGSECDKIMFKKYAPKECREAGVDNEKECNDFMFNKYAPQVTCKDVDDWQCKNSIKENHLGNIVSKQAQFNELRENITQKIGESATVEVLRASLKSAKEIIPFKDQKVNLKIIAVKEDLILDDGDNLIQTGPIAVMVDSDGDGLPDDMEKRFGTDPQKADSDGDGYSDGDEIKNKYSPLGTGQTKEAMSPIDEAIINNKTLGQPKTEGDESEDLIVKTAANKNDEQGQASEGYVFDGQAEPNSVITVYVYSDLPLVATVKVDEYGNWQYELGSSLNEGEHEIYVAVNDNTGKVLLKSKPLNFFIKEAKAVSVKDFIAPATAQTVKKSESSIKYFIAIAILMAIVGILLFVIFHIQRKKYLFKA